MHTVFAISAPTSALMPLAPHEFGWIVIAIIVAQLGVGVLAVRAARRQRREAQHRAR